jgi:hypothetical protein
MATERKRKGFLHLRNPCVGITIKLAEAEQKVLTNSEVENFLREARAWVQHAQRSIPGSGFPPCSGQIIGWTVLTTKCYQ